MDSKLKVPQIYTKQKIIHESKSYTIILESWESKGIKREEWECEI